MELLVIFAELILLSAIVFDQIVLLKKGSTLWFIMGYLFALICAVITDWYTLNSKGESLISFNIQIILMLIYAASSYLYLRNNFEEIDLRGIAYHYIFPIALLFQNLVLFILESDSFYNSIWFRLEIFGAVGMLFLYAIKQLLFVYRGNPHQEDEKTGFGKKYSILFIVFHALQLILDSSAGNPNEAYLTGFILGGITLLTLGYQGWLLHNMGLLSKIQKEILITSEKYVQDKKDDLFNKIDQLVKTKKLYKNPSLSLDMLAKELKINTKYLSQSINQVNQSNFAFYVNSLRVSEFLNEAGKKENRHLNILSIAMSCGFSSKSSFNRIFKEHKGMPPSQFLKEQELNL
ncbi:helix-turn-helix domain-containing protein [Flexithrix dorotheae]|uniref:helix-turn-helix domain-containing protein n=1 Tax=Flexithrix dorotheae TaxID=70993 RepID=UPI0003787026|nr:helix-turn-helix transcriptional regulator [Flexithrix dorotheae]